MPQRFELEPTVRHRQSPHCPNPQYSWWNTRRRQLHHLPPPNAPQDPPARCTLERLWWSRRMQRHPAFRDIPQPRGWSGRVADPPCYQCHAWFAFAGIRLASTPKLSPPPRPSAIQRLRTVSKRCRNKSLSRKRPCRFFKKVEWSGTGSVRSSLQNHRYVIRGPILTHHLECAPVDGQVIRHFWSHPGR